MSLPRIDLPHYTFKLPSTGEDVTFRPFTVKERKLLLIAMEDTKDENAIMAAVRQVATNCIIHGPSVDKFAPFDLEYFFLQLRARSIGETVELKYVCRNKIKSTDKGIGLETETECGAPIGVTYNILDTKIITNPDHVKKLSFENGLGVMMKYPTLASPSLNAKTGEPTDLAFDMIAECVDYVWDKNKIYHAKDSTKEEMVEFIESLPEPDFKKIENFFDTMPYVQDTLKIDCGKCGYHHTITLEGLTSFFE
jgi:hypothetical protein